MDSCIDGLRQFLNTAHSPYHAREGIEALLAREGYVRLEEGAPWELAPGGTYYLTRGTALAAFRLPLEGPRGFLLSASHTDRPGFRLKENLELTSTYTRAAVERYGGAILSSWLDRPLSVAGRVMVETERGLRSVLVDIAKDLLLIPNLAIHMNRKVNEGYAWNPAVDLLPLAGGKDAAGTLKKLLEEQAGGRILGHDLYLYVRQEASVWGPEGEYISAQGLDDLMCVWGCAQGFLKAAPSRAVPVLCLFDSEEVGSASVPGAGSTFLADTLERICRGLGLDRGQMLADSFLVSADNAHAVHPNRPEFADPGNAPVPGEGVVVKFNANQSYCTDGLSAGIFRKICAEAGVPVQTYYNRADLPGGSTLGRISLGQVGVPTVDIGLAQLAMHSCWETASTADARLLEKAMTAYYSTCLELREDGVRLG